MNHRILFLSMIVVPLIFLIASSETANAQVVYGGRTYVRVPNGGYFYRSYARPIVGYYPYSNYPYYTTYAQRPYYPPYGTHYYPHRSFYYAPSGVRYGNQRRYRRR